MLLSDLYVRSSILYVTHCWIGSQYVIYEEQVLCVLILKFLIPILLSRETLLSGSGVCPNAKTVVLKGPSNPCSRQIEENLTTELASVVDHFYREREDQVPDHEVAGMP